MPQKAPLMSCVLVTWFGSGLAPFVPGTFGTLAALPFACIVQATCGNVGLLVFSFLIFGIGIITTQHYLDATGRDDPREVVIDEVAGVCLLLAGLYPTWQSYFFAFIAFRLFDIVKPWPVCVADRKIKGAFGVMFDDMLAGFYPLLLLALAYWLFSLTGHDDWNAFLTRLLGGAFAGPQA